MNTMRKRLSIIFRLHVIFLAMSMMLSCGLGDDKPEDLGVYDIGNFESSCDLNTERLTSILEENILSDINCLETNLNQFVDFVRREDPNFIHREELEKFVNKFFKESAGVAKDVLKLLFDLNSLLLKDPEDKISTSKMKPLFQLFRIANTEGVSLFQSLKGLNEDNYWDRKQRIFVALEKLRVKVLNVITQQDQFQQSLNISAFLEELKEALKIEDDKLNINKIRSFLFIKKLIIGGSPENITSQQVERLIFRVSDLVMLGMDSLFMKSKKFGSLAEEHHFYFDIVSELSQNYYQWNLNEPILSQKDLLVVVEQFLKDKYKVEKMDESIQNLKEKLLGGRQDLFTFKDLNTLTAWGKEFFGMLYFNDVTYEYYDKTMRGFGQITKISLPKIEAYHIFSKSEVKKHWAQFEYISLNYRYFHDDQGFSHYFNHYKRYRNGFNMNSMLKWALTKVVNTYGHYPEGSSRKAIDQDDVRRFLADIEGAAKEIGLWPNDIERFVAEAITSSDLFQYHSDGNETTDSDELTEYVANVLSSYEHTNRIHDKLKAYCPTLGENNDQFEVSCYREYFLHIFFNQLKLGKYYDKLEDYLEMNGFDEVQKYVINIELYARINPDPEVPLTKEDLSRIVVVLTNLESAFLRFDKNRDGILDRGEIDKVFPVFKNLIMKVANLGNTSDGLYKSILLYLIKEMKVPNPVQLLWFHMFGKKKDITSTRYNISAILSNFVIQ